MERTCSFDGAHTHQEKELVQLFRTLNEEGKAEAERYMGFLLFQQHEDKAKGRGGNNIVLFPTKA